MHTYVVRNLEKTIGERLKQFPALVLLGPRQAGKSTLVKRLLQKEKNSLYLDLENPIDLAKLRDPMAFFLENKERLICLDEIQRVPDLFTVLRSVIDAHKRAGQFILLGSASRDLIRQSSESLAGRIVYLELAPFTISEIGDQKKLWLRGGFPDSYLSKTDQESYLWRLAFIQTFLERDIPSFGIRTSTRQIQRLWQMCAHLHGQVLNKSNLGQSLGVNHQTIQHYVDLLSETLMLRVLPPCHHNLKKRLIKAPKIYIRDVGILNTLLRIETVNDLLGHPIYGFAWEGLVIETLIQTYPDWDASFYRSSNGTEIDLILEKGNRRLAFECKASLSPQLTQNIQFVLNDLEIEQTFIIAPVKEGYPYQDKIRVEPLKSVLGIF